MRNLKQINEITELKIVNYRQALFYVTNGVQPIRLEAGRDNKIVYVFSKEETYELYKYWIEKSREYREGLKSEEEL